MSKMKVRELLLFFMVCLMALSINAQRCPEQDFQVGTGVTSEDIGSVRIPANGELALMTNNNAVGCGNSMSQECPSESLSLVGDNGQRKVTSAAPAGFVDLGLPSGTLWKNKNESGFFTYYQAVRFGRNLPTKDDFEELKSVCKWSWTGSGYKVTGPNGNSIYLPATGWRDPRGDMNLVGFSGSYWSSTPNGSEIAWYLIFYSRELSIAYYSRRYGRSVRLVQNKPDRFVDLGLPSGKLWKTENESGFFTHEEALSRFGKNLPSKEDLEELKSVCKWSWTGSGYKVTGPNGNSIYLPAAGFRGSGNTMYYVGSDGNYWSSTPNGSENAWHLTFYSGGVDMGYITYNRCQSVRLVQDNPKTKEESSQEPAIPIEDIEPVVGEDPETKDESPQEPAAPTAAPPVSVVWGNPKTKEESSPKRAVPAGFVDLGLPSGKLWKDKNESGFFTYDQALSRFGKNLPTKEDFEELKLECKWSWTGSGYKVTGSNGNSIYLPAAGYHNSNGNTDNVGSHGYYWSFSPNGSGYAWLLYFYSFGVYMIDHHHSYGQSVRLVQDK